MGNKKQASTTTGTLARLLALDKTFDSLDERIEEASRILRIDLVARNDGKDGRNIRSAPKSGSRTLANYGRHEFVLRWALEKLKTSKNARSSVKAWNLTWRIMEDIPVASVARVLGATDIMQFLVDALEEHFPSNISDVERGLPGEPAQEVNRTVSTDSKSKKRKRSAKDVGTTEAAIAMPPVPDLAERRQLYSHIECTLEVLVQRSRQDQNSAESAASNQMRSIIRLDLPKLIRFVKCWLSSIAFFLEVDLRSGRTPSYELAASCLALMMSVWDSQPTTSSANREEWTKLFGIECLWLATKLLAYLSYAQDTAVEAINARSAANALRILERLLAQQVFLPLRAAFHRSAAPLGSKRISATSLNMHELMQPLRLHFSASGVGSADNSSLESGSHGLPRLLDIAIRCTPLASPKRRMTETPWIDALFNVLVDLVSPTPGSANSGDTIEIRMTLARLLDAVAKQGMSLSTKSLTRLVNEHCHLQVAQAGTKMPKPDLRLIAKILAMDSRIFTDSKADHGEQLFRSLTEHAQVRHVTANDVSAQTLSRDDVAIPLMRAFARVRDLGGYIKHWQQGLERTSTQEAVEWSLWADPVLQDALYDLLESSMTLDQIADLVVSQKKHLLDDSTRTSSLVLLTAIVGAIHSDLALETLEINFKSLLTTIEELLRDTPVEAEHSMPRIWPLLLRLYDRWFSIWSEGRTHAEATSQAEKDMSSSLFRHACAAIRRMNHDSHTTLSTATKHVEEADAAFAFAALLCNLHMHTGADVEAALASLLGNARPWDNSDCYAADCQECDKTSTAFLKIRSQTFAAVMTVYPQLLDLIDSEQRKSYLGTIYKETVEDAASNRQETQHLETMWANLTRAIGLKSGKEVRSLCFETMFHPPRPDKASKSVAVKAEAIFRANVLQQDWPLGTLSRVQREIVFNWIIDMIEGHGLRDRALARPLLSLAIRFCGLPSNTASEPVDPGHLWKMAEWKNGDEDEDSEAESITLDIFGELCVLVLGRLFETRDQEHSKDFIRESSKHVVDFVNANNNLKQAPASATMRLVSIFVMLAETRLSEVTLFDLPHSSSNFITGLANKMQHAIESSGHEQAQISITAAFARSFNTIPASFWARANAAGEESIDDIKYEVRAALRADGPFAPDVERAALIPFFTTLYSREDSNGMCGITLKLLTEGNLDAREHATLMDAFAHVVASLQSIDGLSLAGAQTCPDERGRPEELMLGQIGLACLSRETISDSEHLTNAMMGCLPRLLDCVQTCSDFKTYRQLIACITTILQDKPFLVNQFTLEMTISTIFTLASPSSPDLSSTHAPAIYTDLCTLTQLLLQHHRPSLGGRMHLIVPLLQRLQACLFTPHKGTSVQKSPLFQHPPWLSSATHTKYALRATHAQRFARLLTLLCNPSRSTVQGHRGRRDPADLVDETRKLRIHVGKSVQYLLHSFCALLLQGRLAEGMRDQLRPGLWAMLDVVEIEAGDTRGVKALSSAMGNSERAVLRGVFEEWKRFGAWGGG